MTPSFLKWGSGDGRTAEQIPHRRNGPVIASFGGTMALTSRTILCAALLGSTFASVSTCVALNITPVYDSSINSNANAANLKATITQALSIYSSKLGSNVTFPISFKLSGSISGAQSDYFTSDYSYTSYRSALVSHATTSNDSTALANLSLGPNDPVIGAANISLTTALAFTLGLDVSAASYGTVTFNTTDYQSDPAGFLGVVQHEINEVLGISSSLPNGGGALPVTIFPADLFRYTSGGTRSFTTNGSSSSANRAFFRLSPGGANVQEFNNLPNGGDYGDWAATGTNGFGPAPQDWTGDSTTFTSMAVSSAELTMLDAVGYALVPEPSSAALLAVGLGACMTFRRRNSLRQ